MENEDRFSSGPRSSDGGQSREVFMALLRRTVLTFPFVVAAVLTVLMNTVARVHFHRVSAYAFSSRYLGLGYSIADRSREYTRGGWRQLFFTLSFCGFQPCCIRAASGWRCVPSPMPHVIERYRNPKNSSSPLLRKVLHGVCWIDTAGTRLIQHFRDSNELAAQRLVAGDQPVGCRDRVGTICPDAAMSAIM